MSEKYSDGRFFFANYGCCIPTESYAWILVALFITTILVLLVCMLATATIRWMYKRRMRKRLHDLKRKFLTDQLKAQEFEAKLNFMAQKNKSNRNDDYSREVEKEKFTIFVDPAQHQAQHLNSAKNKKKTGSIQKATTGGPVNGPIYDRDETPIAQSTLASQSNTNAKMRNENRWLHLPKNQKSKSHQDPPNVPSPYVTPSPMTPIPPVAPIAPIAAPVVQKSRVTPPPAQHPPPPPHPPPQQQHIPAGSYYDLPKPMVAPANQKKSPPKKALDFDFGTSPIIPLDPNDVSPEKKNPLAPPTTTTTPTALATPSGFTTTPKTEVTTTPATGTSDASFTTPLTSSAPPTPSPKKNSVQNKPGDDVKQNLKYGMDDIVSPVVPEKPKDKGSDQKDVRKDGAGGKGEWKYYYANAGEENKNRYTSSSVTKSSTSYRRSGSSSFQYDSTGSNRFEAGGSVKGKRSRTGSGKTNSTVSSSILKTDSSEYKTASIEQFPHGAFSFQ